MGARPASVRAPGRGESGASTARLNTTRNGCARCSRWERCDAIHRRGPGSVPRTRTRVDRAEPRPSSNAARRGRSTSRSSGRSSRGCSTPASPVSCSRSSTAARGLGVEYQKVFFEEAVGLRDAELLRGVDRDAGPHDPRLRHRGAEGAAPAEDPPRRGDLRAVAVRADRRFGPGRRADPRARATATRG